MIDFLCVSEFLKENNQEIKYLGNADLSVSGFCSIKNIKNDSITWIRQIKEFDLDFINDDFKLIIICDEIPKQLTNENILIFACENSKYIFFSLLERFFSQRKIPCIASTAVIKTKRIGENASIGDFCFINSEVAIGDNVIIENNVSILCPCTIGDNCMIHAGAVIGADGFGYSKNDDRYSKVLHFGGILIGNNVEIGANTCIDRGTIDNTVISDGVKIDNLCHIAHNVQIGKNSMVIALSMIAGSTVLEENAYIAPGAMILNQLKIGSNSIVGMGAVVTKDVAPRKVVAGVPAKVIRDN